MQTHHVYLIPGFFGFVNFGRLVYFSHVAEYLDVSLHNFGIRSEIHRVRVSPSASLRTRATELAEFVADTAPPGAPIHLIGHSTGGLDARLFIAPGVDLGRQDVDDMARRVRTLVTVGTPHFGTPLASLFTSMLGQRVLQLGSLATVEILRTGRLPLRVVARVGSALARMRLPGGKAEAVLDHLHEEMVGMLPEDDRDHLGEFFAGIGADQALLQQLTPEGIDLFNAGTADRESALYGCVVSRAPGPSFKAQLRLKRRIYSHTTYQLFRFLHGRVGTMTEQYIPELSDTQRDALRAAYGGIPTMADSDGIVPTRSQVRGAIVHAATADHLDLIGHFNDERHVPPHYDWICTAAGFNRRGFEALWQDVARYIARA